MKNLFWLTLFFLNFACSKKSEIPEVVLDYNSGLFMMIADNKTFKTEKNYAAGINPPFGYFTFKGGPPSKFSQVIFNSFANFDEKNKCILYFTSSYLFNPNEVQVITTGIENSYMILNSVRTNATKVIVNHPRGNVLTGTFEMYNGNSLLCKGQYSSQSF
jgi:hypothetical protein